MSAPNRRHAALAVATLLAAQALVAPSLGPATAPLTAAAAATLARRDAEAGAIINSGDKVRTRGCRTVGGGAFRCQIQLIPVHSSSRCRWTDTIRLARGKATISYSRVICSD